MSEQAKKIGESAGATLARFGFKPKPAEEPSAEAEAPAATHTRFGDDVASAVTKTSAGAEHTRFTESPTPPDDDEAAARPTRGGGAAAKKSYKEASDDDDDSYAADDGGGFLCWAKLAGHPWWPGWAHAAAAGAKTQRVDFYGSRDHADVKLRDVVPYAKRQAKAGGSAEYMRGVEEAAAAAAAGAKEFVRPNTGREKQTPAEAFVPDYDDRPGASPAPKAKAKAPKVSPGNGVGRGLIDGTGVVRDCQWTAKASSQSKYPFPVLISPGKLAPDGSPGKLAAGGDDDAEAEAEAEAEAAAAAEAEAEAEAEATTWSSGST